MMNLINLILKSVKEPGKALSIFLNKMLAPIGHTEYQHFLVLTRDRTGSNMFIQLLNSHPNISADYEIFGLLDGQSEEEILSRCFSKQPFYTKAKGFKIFYYHPQDVDDSSIWRMLVEMESLRIIHLKRRNVLHAAVSSRLAYHTGVYGVRSGEEDTQYRKALRKIHYEVDDLSKEFEKTRAWEKSGEQQFAGKEILEIYYEDLVEDRSRECNRAADFLGVERFKPQTDFRKQRTASMCETLENYDELKDAFSGSEWAEFFED